MHDRNDNRGVIDYPIIDSERKPMNKGSPGVSMDQGIHQGVGFNLGEGSQYIIQEFMT